MSRIVSGSQPSEKSCKSCHRSCPLKQLHIRAKKTLKGRLRPPEKMFHLNFQITFTFDNIQEQLAYYFMLLNELFNVRRLHSFAARQLFHRNASSRMQRHKSSTQMDLESIAVR